ncbi:hypothetical protein L484_028098 [Morus notabilis]|uniref:Chromo domain-containing protein n=1 Tax=Morus notabilis TaxID=981085 RepID=W9S844_9ROSA|nr:hypothetical protein L484_028098 [Morus notabilis]
MVYLKLRPYRQRTLATCRNEKLAPRFYGPYEVVARVGAVAYKLHLPEGAQIHHVFHVSRFAEQLAPFSPSHQLPPQLSVGHELLVEPEQVLGVRPGMDGQPGVVKVLLQWRGLPAFEATWEPFSTIQQQFPAFPLEDKVKLWAAGRFTYSRRLKAQMKAQGQEGVFVLHILGCENTTIHDVSIYGDFNTPNTDGIDIEDSNNTQITRCHIDTGDDAICPKTYSGPLINLTTTDSWIRTKSSAIKLGSASLFDFKGLVFDNITIVDSHRGLGFQIRDGGNVSDVTFSKINISTRYYDPSWWGRAEPIYVTTCPRNSSSKEGSISNVLFVNITVNSENGIFLSGSKGGVLRNLRFINVNLTYRRWTKYAGGVVDYRPGCQGLVNRSSAGFLMEHIDGLEVKNVNMRWNDDRSKRWNIPLDFRSATVNNISLLNFHSGLFKQWQTGK